MSLEKQKQIKWIKIHQSQPTDVRPFGLVEVNISFLRGLLKCLTAAKNVNRWFRFEFKSGLHVIENCNNL